ncbi:hypothetical protein [Actinomadura nitritigenes]|uniref:hypothetical protein n=1 Tax=Actinomadura nitritigenes TaxID=134602 RepID=UPI003D8B5D2A
MTASSTRTGPAPIEFRPERSGSGRAAVGLYRKGGRVFSLVRLDDEADAPRIAALLEDAYRLGSGHGPCDRAAEARAVIDDEPSDHARYVFVHSIRPRLVRFDQDGDTTVLTQATAPPGLDLSELQVALTTAYNLGIKTAETDPAETPAETPEDAR